MPSRKYKHALCPPAILFGLPVLLLPGCGTGLPSSVDLPLPDGTSAKAQQGSGAASLSNTQWEIFVEDENGRREGLALVTFGPDGQLPRTIENTFGIPFFGPTLFVDGRRHETELPTVQYAAAWYGAQTSDGTGFAYEGRVVAFVGGFVRAGDAVGRATGTLDPLDPDTMRGTLVFSLRLTVVPAPEGTQEGTVSFIGQRVRD